MAAHDTDYIEIPTRPPLPRVERDKRRKRDKDAVDRVSGIVIYESVTSQIPYLPIMGVQPSRLSDKRLRWRVPADQAPSFDAHHHCRIGRVRRV